MQQTLQIRFADGVIVYQVSRIVDARELSRSRSIDEPLALLGTNVTFILRPSQSQPESERTCVRRHKGRILLGCLSVSLANTVFQRERQEHMAAVDGGAEQAKAEEESGVERLGGGRGEKPRPSLSLSLSLCVCLYVFTLRRDLRAQVI